MGSHALLLAIRLTLGIGIALLGAGDLLPRYHIMAFLPVALLLATHGPGRYSVDALLARRR
jgi:hypothetical protein